MKTVYHLSSFFFKDLLHRKVFAVAAVLGIAFVVLSILLGPMSFSEEERVSINFSLAGSQASLIFLAILVGASFLKNDIESKAIHSLLTRPLSRPQYYISKLLSFIVCLFVLSLSMWLAFILAALLSGFDNILLSLLPFLGIFIEALILFSFAMFLSIFTSSFLAIGASISLFLVGHFINNVEHLVRNSASLLVKSIGTLIVWVLPNLESFNWKSHLTYNEWLSASDYAQVSFYGFMWILCITFFGIFVFSKKDFV